MSCINKNFLIIIFICGLFWKKLLSFVGFQIELLWNLTLTIWWGIEFKRKNINTLIIQRHTDVIYILFLRKGNEPFHRKSKWIFFLVYLYLEYQWDITAPTPIEDHRKDNKYSFVFINLIKFFNVKINTHRRRMIHDRIKIDGDHSMSLSFKFITNTKHIHKMDE